MFIGVLVLLASTVFGEELTIQVERGPAKGRVMHAGHRAVYSFKNIPYAKQPVGNLRFELPEEHEGWLSEVDSEIRCPQNEDEEEASVGEEDCLYLDIYLRKEDEMGNVSLPVVVYFHGGLFHRGSKEDYGPDFLLRFNDVILVIPNYRLGILGFLSFHDAELPGNLGLWDQNAALKWVSQNIGHFGGDPQRVTIAGHEAGAASVGLHVLASASHDYFQGALSASGTAVSPWLVDTNPSTSAAYRVAKHLGCPADSKSEMLSCLKTAPLKDVLEVQGKLSNVGFLPTVDAAAENSFLPFPPRAMYQRGYQKNVNYLIGFTENEASYEVSREFPNVLKYQHLDKMIHHLLQPYFKEVLNFEMIVKAAKYHYLRGVMIPTFESIEPQMTKMMTDFLYRSPLQRVVELDRQRTENIYVYVFKENVKVCRKETRRCFGNENYVFNSTSRESMVDEMHPEVERARETLSKIWGNFIRFGYPDARKSWQPANGADELRYAEISDIVEVRTRYGSEDSEFWMSLVSDLYVARNDSAATPDDVQHVPDYSNMGTWGAAGLAILCGVLCVALVGLVVITKRRTSASSTFPVSTPKDAGMHSN